MELANTQPSSKSLSSVISLNIGGEIFATTRQTILQIIGNQQHLLQKIIQLHENPKQIPESTSSKAELTVQLSNLHHDEENDRAKFLNHNNSEVERPLEVELLYDKDGNIFIDANPKPFQYIIKYLRNKGNVYACNLPDFRLQEELFEDLIQSAQHFQLPRLYHHLLFKKSENFTFDPIHIGPALELTENASTVKVTMSFFVNKWANARVKQPILCQPNIVTSQDIAKRINYFEVIIDRDLSSGFEIGIVNELYKVQLSEPMVKYQEDQMAAVKTSQCYGLPLKTVSTQDRIQVWFDAYEKTLHFSKNDEVLCKFLNCDLYATKLRWYFCVSFICHRDRFVTIVPRKQRQ